MITKKQEETWPENWPGKLTPEQSGDDDSRWAVLIESDNTFHIGQCYENQAAKTVKCAFCGSTEFNVGMGSWFTAIRCKNCEWEQCAHSG